MHTQNTTNGGLDHGVQRRTIIIAFFMLKVFLTYPVGYINFLYKQNFYLKITYVIILCVKISYYLYYRLVSFPNMEAQKEDLYHSVSVQGKARVALVLRD